MPSKKTIGVDRFFETALGAPMTKESGIAKLIQTPLGRAALKHGIPAAIGGIGGYKLAPTPEEQFRSVFKGGILGAGLGFGVRKGIGRLFPKSNFAVTASKVAKGLPKAEAGKFNTAVGKIIRRRAITKPEAENVIKHMTPTMAVAGKGLAAAGAAKLVGDWVLPSLLGVQPVRHVSSQYMGKVSSVRHVVEMPDFVKQATNGKPSYLKQVARGAGPFAIKGSADIPKGSLEGAVEAATLKRMGLKPGDVKPLTKGLGRAAGGIGVGILTAPIFISGVKKMQSDDTKERLKGAAQIVASGSVYQAGKGTAEAMAGKKTFLEALKGVGRTRALIGIPGALGAAYGAGKGSKDKDGKSSKVRAALYGAAGGAAGGALKGVAEVPLEIRSGLKGGAKIPWSQVKKTPNFFKKMVAKGAGRAAAGAAGGAVLGGMFKWLSKKMAGKKPQAPKQRKYLRRWKDAKGEWQYEYPKEKSAAAVTWGPKTGFTVVT